MTVAKNLNFRFQQSPQTPAGFNGYNRPGAPQTPIWQNQNQPFQQHQYSAPGFQVVPNQGFPSGGPQPFGADANNVSLFKFCCLMEQRGLDTCGQK